MKTLLKSVLKRAGKKKLNGEEAVESAKKEMKERVRGTEKKEKAHKKR